MQEMLLRVNDFIPDYFANKTWQSVPANPAGLNLIHLTTVTDDNYLYAIGGIISDIVRNRVHRYDGVTNTWAIMSPMPVPKCLHCCCLHNGNIYVFAGLEAINTANSNTAYKYNIANNQWSGIANVPVPVQAGSAVVVNGKIYICNGAVDTITDLTHVFYEYDPLTDVYVKLPDPPFLARRSAGIAAIGDEIFVLGGLIGNIAGGTYRRDFWKYNVTTQIWTELEPLAENMSLWGALSKYDNNHLMLLGGTVYTTTTNTVNRMRLYNIKTNEWKTSSTVLPLRATFNTPIKFKNFIVMTNGWISTNGTPTYSANCYRLPLS